MVTPTKSLPLEHLILVPLNMLTDSSWYSAWLLTWRHLQSQFSRPPHSRTQQQNLFDSLRVIFLEYMCLNHLYSDSSSLALQRGSKISWSGICTSAWLLFCFGPLYYIGTQRLQTRAGYPGQRLGLRYWPGHCFLDRWARLLFCSGREMRLSDRKWSRVYNSLLGINIVLKDTSYRLDWGNQHFATATKV